MMVEWRREAKGDGMKPEEFVGKWANPVLRESQGAQHHFLDVCRLVGVEMPGDGKTENGDAFVFEQSLKQATGHGFADVWYENHFAVEYKSPGKYKDLRAAYEQLQRYRENLNNPPLLVVTDFERWEIHTNFPNTQKRVYAFSHAEIASNAEAQGWLRDMFHAPERLHPQRNTEQVTKEAAQAFQVIAENMREWETEPQGIALFLTKLVFCLFAEDIGLLPNAVNSPDGIFTFIIKQSRGKPNAFKQEVRNLFLAMNRGEERFHFREIPYFNGTLFDVITVEDLSVEAIDALALAADLNWAEIEPSIFGTLFERSLDPSKRAQRGAHYTSREDILLIIEPVLMQPLRYAWDTVQLEAQPIRERYDSATTGRAKTNARNQLLDLREGILKRIRGTTVLDPACGSGNFLYVSLQMLMDLEKEVITSPLWAGMQMATREVHPRQMYGIEIDPIAHALASIVVWIGYIQWRIKNGYGREFGEPILEKLLDNIVCKDAILPPSVPANPPQFPQSVGGKMTSAGERHDSRRGEAATRPQTEIGPPSVPRRVSVYATPTSQGEGVDWPAVDVIVGNPPFLGDKMMRGELGDAYVDRLREFYRGRLPGGADLVTYWFEKAREQIESGHVKRAGLLATNSIRGGANRAVLTRIKDTGDIFMAWSDRDWILDGAAVRVSMVGFDDGYETNRMLDGLPADFINHDLTARVDVTQAAELQENQDLSFIGVQKSGPFDVDSETAMKMIQSENATGANNAEVIRPTANAHDLVHRSSNTWLIDFNEMPLDWAKQYEAPFQHVLENVKPSRDKNRRARTRERWWIHGESRPGMRNALTDLDRFVCTPVVSKHRVFVWQAIDVLPSNLLVVLARDDDYFYGVLHSFVHEVWVLAKGTALEDRPRYSASTTFETFPFPWPPSQEDTSHPAHARISAAAKQLHEERHAWQHPDNPPKSSAGSVSTRPRQVRGRQSMSGHATTTAATGPDEPPPIPMGGPRGVKDRTLTNLYNALQVYRGQSAIKVKPAAGDFAPRLDELHRELDEAVCDAYGWEYAILEDEEEILRRLLELNLARAGD